MRILVADQNALLLAAIAATFGRHCEIVTATRRDVCMAHVEQRHFDVVVACEKLVGYTGLELLSEVEAVSPTTLRIFAARPEALEWLGKRLDFFGLLGTLHYPIEARKLLVALKVARSKLPGRPKPLKVKHVVLENEWGTGERLALLGQKLEDAPAVEPDEAAAHRTTMPESPASEEPTTEFWAAPGSAVEPSALVRARHLAEASSFEVSFEVSFDENPSEFEVTGHGAAHADASTEGELSGDPASVDGDATAPADETAANLDAGAANDELFSDTPATEAQRRESHEAPPARQPKRSGGNPTKHHRCDVGRGTRRGAAAQRPTAYASALAQAQKATANASTSATQASSRPGQAAPDLTASITAPKPTSSKPTASQPAAPTTASKPAATNPPSRPGTAKVPRHRKPTVPTAAQREAFQRALARRNAARAAGMIDAPLIDFSSMSTMSATRPVQASGGRPAAGTLPAGSSQSLADLARMATTKRPLPGFTRSGRGVGAHGPQPKRRVFVVGSGIAAALLVAVVCFELLTNPSHERGRHARAASVQLFSPASTLVADNSGNPPQVFSPPPPQPAAIETAPGTASGLPQAQTFDPDTAPPDPPPPPALELPGPMEPPSMGHHGRPPGVQDNSADE